MRIGSTTTRTRALWGMLAGACVLALVAAVTVLRDPLEPPASPETARLFTDFERLGKPTPPEARTLIAMKQHGASSEEMVAYVRTSFPNDLMVRAVALRWLGVDAKPRKGADPGNTSPPPDPGGGRLIRTDALR